MCLFTPQRWNPFGMEARLRSSPIFRQGGCGAPKPPPFPSTHGGLNPCTTERGRKGQGEVASPNIKHLQHPSFTESSGGRWTLATSPHQQTHCGGVPPARQERSPDDWRRRVGASLPVTPALPLPVLLPPSCSTAEVVSTLLWWWWCSPLCVICKKTICKENKS